MVTDAFRHARRELCDFSADLLSDRQSLAEKDVDRQTRGFAEKVAAYHHR